MYHEDHILAFKSKILLYIRLVVWLNSALIKDSLTKTGFLSEDSKLYPYNKILIKFNSEESSLFTERSGKGLEAVQYIVNAILNRTLKPHTMVQIDTANYWDRKEKDISKEVDYAVKELKKTSQPRWIA